MAVTISPTTLTVAGSTPGTFNASLASYTGKLTASTSDATKARVYVRGPVVGAGSGAGKEGFGPTQDFAVVWVATGSATVTVSDDAGNTGTCVITSS